MVKQRPILLYGAGDMKTDDEDLNNEECDKPKKLRFKIEDSNDDKYKNFRNEDSKEVNYKRLGFGIQDLKENMGGLKKKKVAKKKKRDNYNQRSCKLCQMTVYESPYKQEPEKCRACDRRVIYHCYRCCGCGCIPMDSRKFIWDERSKISQYEDGDDGDELLQEYYDT